MFFIFVCFLYFGKVLKKPQTFQFLFKVRQRCIETFPLQASQSNSFTFCSLERERERESECFKIKICE